MDVAVNKSIKAVYQQSIHAFTETYGDIAAVIDPVTAVIAFSASCNPVIAPIE